VRFSRIAMTLVALGALVVGTSGLLGAQAPAGATAKCGDGSYSKATSKQGACSNHKGVAEWYGAGAPAAKPAPKEHKAAPAAAPAGATARCKDGTYSTSTSHTGACSKHGGVAEWLGGAAAPAAPAPAAAAPAEAAAPAPAGAPADATAQCNDGTFSNSQHRSGTCSHHGGVKKWLKDVPN